ncbi:SPOR domain-containing protein [Pedobacter flavus]|uniref:SPOR domain-containing protein n=1 Tax=Pedobacter flavus TaxID=3113906 RepID=A0ABU7GZH3_9SPHI|nr:SPOR domain-containing protein [Pedobacter sp. VNH31]MEE1884183.1 SPOR domain-containing protein [Pedobacter sp. VNH31]
MKRNYIFIVILLFCVIKTSAQIKGEVTVIKDPSIDSLILKRIAITKKTTTPVVPAKKPGTTLVDQYGFRVQIFYGSDRREIFNQQAKFKSLYPKYNAYISFKSPNYYLRVGDFRTRQEAQNFLNELRPKFPTLFIFREKINAPNLD